jgi:hypothetical protein
VDRVLHAGDPVRLGFETRKEQAMATLNQVTAHEQRVMNTTIIAKAGAVAYVIWGLLHLLADWSVYTLGRSMPSGMASGRAWHAVR